MRIRVKCQIFKWMPLLVFAIVSVIVYALHKNVSNGTRVSVNIRETVEKLSQAVTATQQRTHTEFISLVNIFQSEGNIHNPNGPINEKAGVTWCSSCDEKHLHYVRKIAAFWDGPISIAVYTYGSKIPYTLKYLSALRHCDANVKRKVRFHLSIPEAEVGQFVKQLTDDIQTTDLTCDVLQLKMDGAVANFAGQNTFFPVNYLRNVALRNAHTSHVINVDIDFTPSKDLCERFLNFLTVSGETAETETKMAFVLPSFESNTSLESPISRDELLERWTTGSIRPYYEKTCKGCQRCTNYTRWRALNVAHLRRVSLAYYPEVKSAYEPFVIARKDQMPYFDERFRGFGFNRLSQICEMYMSGFDFAVVDNGFVIHDGFKGVDPAELNDLKRKSYHKNHRLFVGMNDELQGRYPNRNSHKC